MAIKLSEIQIEKLKARKNKDIVVWRPPRPFSQNVHIGLRCIEWTFCGHCPLHGISSRPWTWTDNFCERCVEAALKYCYEGAFDG